MVASIIAGNASDNAQQCVNLWELNMLSQTCSLAVFEKLYSYAQSSLRESRSQAQFYLSVKLATNVLDMVKCGQI